MRNERVESSRGRVMGGAGPRAAGALVMLLGAALLSCKHVNARPAPPKGSWLVLLCKASDAQQEPHPKSFYEDLFGKNQRDLLFDFFDLTSNHAVDVSATEVFGWFPMNVSTADIGPTVRNNGTSVTRTQTARDCRNAALGGMAAQGFSVDPGSYAGTITVINVPVDSGATGEHSVVVNGEPDVSFYEHEMIHSLGVTNHSWRTSPDATSDHVWDHGGDAEYGDCWDIMSWLTCVFMFQTPRGGQGPELEAAFRQQLRWLPTNRAAQAGYGTSALTLAPIGDPSRLGPFVATVDVPGKGSYLVEYRQRTGFDRGLPLDAVVIREQRNTPRTYLVVRQNGDSAWRQGETFTDSGNYLSIRVDAIGQGAASLTIDTLYSAGAVGAGAICGDKYHGQVRACPAGTQCMAKRSGQIQTIDYFCL